MERITSRQNAIVKRFRELARAPGTATSSEILLDGAHLLQEALATGISVEVAAFSERHLAHTQSPLAQLARDLDKRGGRTIGVTDQVLAAMSPVEHSSGVVAIAHAQPSRLDAAFAVGTDLTGGSASLTPLILVLAGIQDPGNVGAIVRTAAACGATGVVAMEGSANPFGWKALRGAMGGTFHLPVAAHSTLADIIRVGGSTDVRLVAAVPRGGTPLPQLDLRVPTAIVLGAEGDGVTEPVIDTAAKFFSLQLRPPDDTSNVDVMEHLTLYLEFRQRDQEKP
jgi:TrmH family RNA methyltransferase